MKNKLLMLTLIAGMFGVSEPGFSQEKKMPVFYREALSLVSQAGNFRVFILRMANLSPQQDRRAGLVIVYYNPATKKTERSNPIWDYETADILKFLDTMGSMQNKKEINGFEDDFTLISAEGCEFLTKKDPHSDNYKAALQLNKNLIEVTFKELGDIRNLIIMAADKLKNNPGN